MSDPVGFDFNDTLDFLSVLQDSVPSLQSRDEYATTFLDSQLMSFNENLDCSPDATTPGESSNYLFVPNDSPPSFNSQDSQDRPSTNVSMMTDDATFLTEFSSIHSGVKSERKSINTHSPLTPHSSSKGSTYDNQPQNMFNSGSMSNPVITTPQSNPLRGGSSLASVNASKSPVDDLFPPEGHSVENSTSSQEFKLTPKAVVSKRKVTKAPKKLKLSHNVIEKKYRTNINTKILELRDVVPSLRIKASSQNMSVADLEGLTPASKLNKASVLTKATEYIKHLESKHVSLDNKIAALQNMISQSPTGSMDAKMPMTDMMGDVSSSQRSGLSSQRGQGFYGNTPVNVQYANQYSDPSTHTQNCGISNSNLFMGGFATLLGANFVSEDNFRGMASLPFFPAKMAISPSAQSMLVAKNFLMVMGVLSMAVSIYNFVAPIMSRFFEKGTSQFSLQCLKLQPLSASEKQFVLDHVSGKRRASVWSLIRCHIILIGKEKNFENCFLLLLVSSLLTNKAPVISRSFSVAAKLKVKNLNTLPCNEKDEGLQNLSKLTKDMDGLNLFHCDNTISRLCNLSDQKLINYNVRLVEYSSAYVDVYLKNKNNFYSVVFGWRVLAIIYKLNLAYLDVLATPQERREEKLGQFTIDLAKLEKLLGKSSSMNNYLYSLQMIAQPSMAPQILETISEGITQKLITVLQLFENREVTDGEMSDLEVEEDEEVEEKPTFDVMRKYKSLVSSMELMNEERFIAITVSLAVQCLQQQKEKEVLQLLQYLKFDKARPLSLLSFTALVQLMTQLIVPDSEQLGDTDSDVFSVKLDISTSLALEVLLKMMRTWLKDDKSGHILSQALRVDLTEIVMNRALILNKL